ncbi:hypothetical protein ACLMJK_008268 [Lecanora helva]
MALKSPLMPSPDRALVSAFSPYSDSPTSPVPFKSPTSRPTSNDYSTSLRPPSVNSPFTSSPSDIPDPSPIATSSNGTDTTDFDDTGEATEDHDATPQPSGPTEPPLRLDTASAASEAKRARSDEDEQPSSVIHAPQGFDAFHRNSPKPIHDSSRPSSQTSDIVVVSPPEDDGRGDKKATSGQNPASPPPIQTTIAPARDWSATPRAQTRPEVEAQNFEAKRPQTSRSSSRSSNLEDIPEASDADISADQESDHHASLFEHTVERFQETADEVAALKVALSECWTLCNTLAGLSYIHRERIFSDERSFNSPTKGDVQAQAWKSCWKLCQKLYETRDEEVVTQVRPTLDLCRDFCQCLFEVRRRDNEIADSVLRVSFELNNHLYNTHDRTLPEAFRERTLDFYITLCHRLMKQRSDLARETDSLLEACWSLAEMLFSLRQNRREGKAPDEELLGSAVQACWELCDLFREGWTQIRPDRGTPRPSQTTFTQAFQQAKQSQVAAQVSDFEESEEEDFGRANPETPSTVFEDTQPMSPDDGTVPNILVLGPSEPTTRHQQPSHHKHQWSSSSSSTLSSRSKSSRKTGSSTSTIMNDRATTPTPTPTPIKASTTTEDPHLICLKLLILKAAINIGFQRPPSHSSSTTSSPPSTSSATTSPKQTTLATFIKSVPSNSFGTHPWQLSLLENYKKLIANDPVLGRGPLPSPGTTAARPIKARAADVARAVQWMVKCHVQYSWLRDLYRWVFGERVEDGEGRGGSEGIVV